MVGKLLIWEPLLLFHESGVLTTWLWTEPLLRDQSTELPRPHICLLFVGKAPKVMGGGGNSDQLAGRRQCSQVLRIQQEGQ